jgi:hypothetical protein
MVDIGGNTHRGIIFKRHLLKKNRPTAGMNDTRSTKGNQS